MSVDMIAPAWMHAQITAEEYKSWSEEQCAGIEIVDGMVIVSPSAFKRHNRLARVLANALDAAAGPDWNADTDFDVRLQDVPLTNRRPDVVVYRADTLDITPTRPGHVLLAAEIVSPGSETTDRIVKLDQYARAGIPFYWRVELTATRLPVVYTYLLDSASRRYRDSDVFTTFVDTHVQPRAVITSPEWSQRDRRAPLLPVHRQRGAEEAVAHPHRADALLPRP